VRDSAVTVGRTTRDFVKGGTPAAKRTWRENTEMTEENAKAGARHTRAKAHAR
jgi:hypothetical protein